MASSSCTYMICLFLLAARSAGIHYGTLDNSPPQRVRPSGALVLERVHHHLQFKDRCSVSIVDTVHDDLLDPLNVYVIVTVARGTEHLIARRSV